MPVETLVLIAATFLLAGAVKGVIGLGLPTVSLGLLTATLDLTTAMALMVVPSLVTNLWQALVGGAVLPLLRRLWPFLLTATLTIWIGALALSAVPGSTLRSILGFVLIAYGVLGLAGVRLTIQRRTERAAGPLFGAINGVLTGMTGSFVVPGVLYLQAIGLPRDQFVQAMGLLFSLSTLGVAVALGGHGLWTGELGLVSTAALVPALLGMMLGQKLRGRLDEATFRRVFFGAILALGGIIVLRETDA